MKKEMKQVLWVVALFVILMTATGNLVSAAGFDWSVIHSGMLAKKCIPYLSGQAEEPPLLYIKNWKRNRNMVP